MRRGGMGFFLGWGGIRRARCGPSGVVRASRAQGDDLRRQREPRGQRCSTSATMVVFHHLEACLGNE
jgi:hypothetical protein